MLPLQLLAADPEGTAKAPAPTSTNTAWFGVSMGFIVTPMRPYRTAPTPRLDAGRMRACGKLEIYRTRSDTSAASLGLQCCSTHAVYKPGYIADIHTGLEGGWTSIDSRRSRGYVPGEIKQVRYGEAPSYIAANVYLFRWFP